MEIIKKHITISILSMLLTTACLSQSTSHEKWGYITARISVDDNNFKQTVISPLFTLEYEDLKENKKLKTFIKDSFELFLSKNIESESTIDNIYIHSFETKLLATKHYERTFETENLRVKQELIKPYLDPFYIKWELTNENHNKNKVFSIYEDGWNTLNGSKRNLHLKTLSKHLSPSIKLDTTSVVVKTHELSFYDEGLLIEYIFDFNEKENLIYNIMSTKDTLFLLSNSKQIMDFAKERKPFLPKNNDVIDYLKLSVNKLFHEDSRFFIMTPKKLLQENYELRKSAMNWSFEVKNPKVIYKGSTKVLISAMAYYNETINIAIFEVDRFSGEIKMKDEHEVSSAIKYKIGIPYKDGCLIKK